MASLWGPTDSPPKFISASACSPNHNHRHNKFKSSFIWHRHFSMCPLRGTEETALLLFGKTLSWYSQIFCSLENASIKEKKTRKPIYWQFSASQKHRRVFSSIRPQVLLLIQNSTVKFIQNTVNVERCLMVKSKWLLQTLKQSPLQFSPWPWKQWPAFEQIICRISQNQTS